MWKELSGVRKGGFTLVELLIVIIVIAVLSAVAIPKFTDRSQRAKESALRADLKNLREAVDRFRADTDLWPGSLADLDDTTTPAFGFNGGGQRKTIPAGSFKGPYLTRAPVSPITGAPYNYDTNAPKVGSITHPSGRALDGSDYATW